MYVIKYYHLWIVLEYDLSQNIFACFNVVFIRTDL